MRERYKNKKNMTLRVGFLQTDLYRVDEEIRRLRKDMVGNKRKISGLNKKRGLLLLELKDLQKPKKKKMVGGRK